MAFEKIIGQKRDRIASSSDRQQRNAFTDKKVDHNPAAVVVATR